MYVISEILVTPIFLQIGTIKSNVSSREFTLVDTLPSLVAYFLILLRCKDDGEPESNIIELVEIGSYQFY